MFQRKNEFCHFGEIKNEIEDSIFICKLFFRLGTHHYVTFSIRPSIRLSVRLSNHPSVCHTPYLRNSKAFDHDFWYTCVKWRYLQGVFFSFFLKFWFFGLLGGGGAGGGVKGKKMAQDDKKILSCTSYLRNHTSYDLDLWYTCGKA